MRKLFTTLLLTALFFQVHATHFAGGQITYTHISGLDYKVKLKLYRDCSAGGMMSSISTISMRSISLAQNTTATLMLIDSGVISNYCPSLINSCNSLTALYPGFSFGNYEGIVSLSAPANDWVFSYGNCCRNNLIGNLLNPASQNIFLYSKLDNLNALGGFNSSCQFLLHDQLVYNINQPYSINQSSFELDGDSLSYSLVPVVIGMTGGVLNSCNYLSPFTGTSPLGSIGTINIDNQTGVLNFDCTIIGTFVIGIQVDEYRNGMLIGSTMKDLQFTFINPTSINTSPLLSGINGTTSFTSSYSVCLGSPLSFTVSGSDLNITDSVHVTVDSSDILGYTFTSNNALQETLTFNWSPSISDIRPQPYLLVLSANDDSCSKVTYAYLIYINQCNTDTVWAGDANADYTVNNYDVLNIGIGNGSTGIVRPSATTNWVAEYCPNWTNSFISGINYKHADCNGDGIINATDLAAITLNYGQIHLKNEVPGSYKTAGLPDLYFDLTGINPIAGTTIQVPVMLGTTSAIMNDIYGIACHFNISNAVSAPISFTNTSSWIGDATNSFLFQKNINSNNLAMAMVRNNQTNINGFGQIGILSIPIDANAPANSDMILNFTDIKLIMNDGTEITDYNVINDTLKIVSPNNIEDATFQNEIEVYPNPIKDQLTIKFNQNENESYSISITDIMGRILISQTLPLKHVNQEFTLNTSILPRGNYILKINSATNSYVQKIIK